MWGGSSYATVSIVTSQNFMVTPMGGSLFKLAVVDHLPMLVESVLLGYFQDHFKELIGARKRGLAIFCP